jgi:hypothetical protein
VQDRVLHDEHPRDAEWDKAAGFSFWVKGDGSKHFGAMQFIWNEDYAARYDVAFPLDGTEWKKIVVAWRDLVPVLPSAPRSSSIPRAERPVQTEHALVRQVVVLARRRRPLLHDRRNAPRADDRPRHRPLRAQGNPLERIQAKVKAGKPVTIVTMGDSLTDYNHWANRQVNWPTLLKTKLKEKYKVDAKIINPAIGGTQLRQASSRSRCGGRGAGTRPRHRLLRRQRLGVRHAGRDVQGDGAGDDRPRPAGDPRQDRRAVPDDRPRRGTVDHVCGAVGSGPRGHGGAQSRPRRSREGFHAAGGTDKRESLYCTDKTHLGAAGHEIFATTVLSAIESGGK